MTDFQKWSGMVSVMGLEGLEGLMIVEATMRKFSFGFWRRCEEVYLGTLG